MNNCVTSSLRYAAGKNCTGRQRRSWPVTWWNYNAAAAMILGFPTTGILTARSLTPGSMTVDTRTLDTSIDSRTTLGSPTSRSQSIRRILCATARSHSCRTPLTSPPWASRLPPVPPMFVFLVSINYMRKKKPTTEGFIHIRIFKNCNCVFLIYSLLIYFIYYISFDIIYFCYFDERWFLIVFCVGSIYFV